MEEVKKKFLIGAIVCTIITIVYYNSNPNLAGKTLIVSVFCWVCFIARTVEIYKGEKSWQEFEKKRLEDEVAELKEKISTMENNKKAD